jgi:YfiR/HmsC-like
MKSVCTRVVSLALCASACLFLARMSGAQSSAEAMNAKRLEARYLYDFAEFVDWPEEPQVTSHHTMNFCVLGDDPFGRLLDASVLGHPIGDRSAMVVRGEDLRFMGRCDVLFVSLSANKNLARILRQLRGKSILTVGSAPDFALKGGMIQFRQKGNEVHLVINMDAAERAGLRIRAPLLALAKIVHNQASKQVQ